MTSRSYLFTIFIDQLPEDGLTAEDRAYAILFGFHSGGGCNYTVAQLESCPTTGRLYVQGYTELDSSRRVAWVKRQMGIDSVHLERRAGTREQARDYCQKEETRVSGPWEFGTWSDTGAGRRSDLATFYEALKKKPDLRDDELLDSFPGTYLKYPHAADNIRRILVSTQSRSKPIVTLLLGPPGCGKSRWCHEHRTTAYWKAPDRWWSDYNGTDDVVLDDYYGWLPFHELLRLLDRYPVKVEIKGSHVQFNPPQLLLTSNKHPLFWYKEEVRARYDFTALYRRIDRVIVWSSVGVDPVVVEENVVDYLIDMSNTNIAL